MPRKRVGSFAMQALVVISLALLLTSGTWAAPKYKVLHAFGAGKDGGGLFGGLAFDSMGNVYGTTSGGGAYGHGTVFKLTLGSKGKWSETVLHSFPSFADDGGGPTDGLILDPAGNLYGTTEGGGDHHSGVVFELAHDSRAESILYNFCAKPKCSDGGSPYAGLVMDKAGDMYGTGYAAFELSPGDDGWKETVLHDFTGQHGDGFEPLAGVILDSVGNVYGTTERGGTDDVGTVYRLRPTSSGWKESVLHSFGAFHDDGQVPGVGALVSDASGNLYGTTSQGGRNTCSTLAAALCSG